MNFYKRFFGHLKTIMRHRREVRKLCFKCGLYWQGLTHDLSKYSPTEFWNGVKFYTGTKSPHCGEREKYGYSKAWIHHHNRNKHHAEYWQDIVNERNSPIYMPMNYLAEMICDRIAASKIYLKDKYTDAAPLEYFTTHQNENPLSADSKAELCKWLVQLKECGEEEICKELREWIKKAKGTYLHFASKKTK